MGSAHQPLSTLVLDFGGSSTVLAGSRLQRTLTTCSRSALRYTTMTHGPYDIPDSNNNYSNSDVCTASAAAL